MPPNSSPLSTTSGRIGAAIISLLWLTMVITILTQKASPLHTFPPQIVSQQLNTNAVNDNSALSTDHVHVKHVFIPQHEHHDISRPIRARSVLSIPSRIISPPSDDSTMISPPSREEISHNMTIYLHELHRRLEALAGPDVEASIVWTTFLEVTKSMWEVWDEQNRHRFPVSREDGSIFVALGTYRDPFCVMTMKSLFDKASNPGRLHVALFQQNCFGPVCRTGVLAGGAVNDAGPDDDCYELFCASAEGVKSNACNTGLVHVYNVNESESLGPYMARYLGAKFYAGEQYYLQIDSHSEFIQGWDDELIKMVVQAPAKKAVISAYPPDSTANWKGTPGATMCDSGFADDPIEFFIIRLTATESPMKAYKIATYAPFVAAGFLFGPATLLHDVPFDPFLPWIFMGEEISMSARLWTAGYDIFSPTINVLNHYYVRRHYPKFWESVNRFFKKPIHNDLSELVIRRVKAMLEYPESTPLAVTPKSLLYRLDDWSLGRNRSFNAYMKMVSINTLSKKHPKSNKWCHRGYWPDEAKQYKTDEN